MSLSSHPFWYALADARRAGRPCAWSAPFGGPIASAQSIFSALLEVGRRRREDDAPLAQRLFADREPVPITDAVLPGADDGSMARYVRRLDAALGETGFVVNDLQAATPDMWRLAAAVSAGLRGAADMPPGGGSFDLFAGAYRSGFFGVHKDDQEVVTFVIEGKKRFLVWPYEALRDHPAVPHGSERKAVLLKDFDYADIRAEAIVVEGGPGDVFYWPVEHWHVAESDGDLCTTIGFGLFRDNSPTQLLEQAVRELVDEGLVAPPDELPVPERSGGDARALLAAAKRGIDAALDHPAMVERIEDKLLTLSTSFGFRTLPPLARDAVAPERARLVEPALLAWWLRGDALVWSVGGAIFRYPAAPALVELMQRLGRGEVIDLADTATHLASGIDPAAIRHVLDVLARHHALEAAPTQASREHGPLSPLAAAA